MTTIEIGPINNYLKIVLTRTFIMLTQPED